jgi:hypothetical protein
MSKLDRQIDQAAANPLLKIIYREFDDVDTAAIRKQLFDSIAAAESRVPLDCRDVDGAPDELVDLLLEANEVAKGCRKRLILSYASDELRQALRPGVHRRGVRDTRLPSVRVDAATAAAESLRGRNSVQKPPETKPAPLVLAIEPSPDRKIKLKQRLKLLSVIVVGAMVLIGFEWWLMNQSVVPVDASGLLEQQPPPPIKTFEDSP